MGPWEHVDQTLNRLKSRSLADSAYSSAEHFHQMRRSADVLRFAETLGSLTEAERRKQKRMLVMQEIFEGSPNYQCTKCEELKKKYAIDRKRYFLEAEHLRRGVQKLLDTCQSLMSASAFWVLKDSLQLGVRFFTDHTDDSYDTPPPTLDSPGEPVEVEETGNKELDRLLRENARLGEDVRRLERENAHLSKELAAQQGRFIRASGGRGSGSRTVDVAVQTDPMRLPTAKPRAVAASLDLGFSDDESESAVVSGGASQQPKRGRSHSTRKRRSTAGESDGTTGETGDHSDDEDYKPGGGSAGTSKARQLSKPQKQAKPEVPDQSKEIERLKDELEVLRKKLKAAELLAEQAKKAAENVQVITVEKPQEEKAKPVHVASSEGREGLAPAATANASADGAGSGGRGSRSRGTLHAGGRGSVHGLHVPDDPGAKPARRRSGLGTLGSTKRLGTTGQLRASTAGSGEEHQAIPMGTAARVAAAVAAAEAKWKEEAQAKKNLIDACVGNGPGPGMQDEPVRCHGKQIKKLEELNKTGVVFQRTIRLGPDLGSSPFVGLANTGAAASHSGTAVASTNSGAADTEQKPNQSSGAAAEPSKAGKASSVGERRPSNDAEARQVALLARAQAKLRSARSMSPDRETLPGRPPGGKLGPEQEQPKAPATAPAQSATRAQASAPMQSRLKLEARTEAQTDALADARADVRADVRAFGEGNVQPGMKPDVPPDVRPDVRPVVRPDMRPDGRVDVWANVPADLRDNALADAQVDARDDAPADLHTNELANVRTDARADVRTERAEAQVEAQAETQAEAGAGRATASPTRAHASTWAGVPFRSTLRVSEKAEASPSAGAPDADAGGGVSFNNAEPRVAGVAKLGLASTLGAAPYRASPQGFFRESRPVRQMGRASSASRVNTAVEEEPLMDTWPGADTLREAEPYLLQVWDQRGQGNKRNHQSELVKLGALTPQPPNLPRTVSSNTLAALLRD